MKSSEQPKLGLGVVKEVRGTWNGPNVAPWCGWRGDGENDSGMTEQEVQIVMLGGLAGCSSRMKVSEFFR